MMNLIQAFNNKRKLVFIHIMKTAGTTVDEFICQHLAVSDIAPFGIYETVEDHRDIKKLKISLDQFSKYLFLRDHIGYNIRELLEEEPIYITFLRNPIDRIISLYYYMRSTPQEVLDQIPESLPWIDKAKSSSLHDFVCSSDPAVQTHIWNVQTRQLACDLLNTFKPSHYTEKELLELAKQHLDEFAVVGITEKFEDSIKLLCYEFGWLYPNYFDKLNVTSNKIVNEQLPSHTIEAIQERTQLDRQLYDYACDIFATRYDRMVRELLNKDYELAFAQRYPDRLDSVNLYMDQPISGSGWHRREGVIIDGVWKWTTRWTGSGTMSILDLRLSDRTDLEIKFHVISYITLDVLQSLVFKVNEVTIATEVIDSELEGMIYRGIIPKTILKQSLNLTRITFQVNRTVSPKELNPEIDDSRKLGIAITQIWVNPVVSNESTASLTQNELDPISPDLPVLRYNSQTPLIKVMKEKILSNLKALKTKLTNKETKTITPSVSNPIRLEIGSVFDPATHYIEEYYNGVGLEYMKPDGTWNIYYGPSPTWHGFSIVAEIMDRILPKEQGRKLLDVGCSFGDFIHKSVEKGWDAYGVDISTKAATKAHPDIRDRIICADVTHPNAALKSKAPFDVITTWDFWEHIYETDLDKLMCGLFDLLKPGGIMFNIICTSSQSEGDWVIERGTKFTPENSSLLCSGHITIHTWNWWIEKFSQQGYIPCHELAYRFQVSRAEDNELSTLTSWSSRNLLVLSKPKS